MLVLMRESTSGKKHFVCIVFVCFLVNLGSRDLAAASESVKIFFGSIYTRRS